MIHFLKLEIVANVGKFLFGVLRQIVIALFIYFSSMRRLSITRVKGEKCGLRI